MPQTKKAKNHQRASEPNQRMVMFRDITRVRLTKKAEPPPTRDVNRDSGTESANGGWLRRLVRRTVQRTFRNQRDKMDQHKHTKTG